MKTSQDLLKNVTELLRALFKVISKTPLINSNPNSEGRYMILQVIIDKDQPEIDSLLFCSSLMLNEVQQDFFNGESHTFTWLCRLLEINTLSYKKPNSINISKLGKKLRFQPFLALLYFNLKHLIPIVAASSKLQQIRSTLTERRKKLEEFRLSTEKEFSRLLPEAVNECAPSLLRLWPLVYNQLSGITIATLQFDLFYKSETEIRARIKEDYLSFISQLKKKDNQVSVKYIKNIPKNNQEQFVSEAEKLYYTLYPEKDIQNKKGDEQYLSQLKEAYLLEKQEKKAQEALKKKQNEDKQKVAEQAENNVIISSEGSEDEHKTLERKPQEELIDFFERQFNEDQALIIELKKENKSGEKQGMVKDSNLNTDKKKEHFNSNPQGVSDSDKMLENQQAQTNDSLSKKKETIQKVLSSEESNDFIERKVTAFDANVKALKALTEAYQERMSMKIVLQLKVYKRCCLLFRKISS